MKWNKAQKIIKNMKAEAERKTMKKDELRQKKKGSSSMRQRPW